MARAKEPANSFCLSASVCVLRLSPPAGSGTQLIQTFCVNKLRPSFARIDVCYPVAAAAIAEHHRRGKVLHVAPQNLVEFRNVAKRRVRANGMGPAGMLSLRFLTAFRLLTSRHRAASNLFCAPPPCSSIRVLVRSRRQTTPSDGGRRGAWPAVDANPKRA
jgi:hypothetical protein